MIFIDNSEKKCSELDLMASVLADTNEKFHKTIYMVNQYASEEIDLAISNNEELLEMDGISPSELRKVLFESMSRGNVSFSSSRFYNETLYTVFKPLKKNIYFEDQLWLAEIVKKEWNDNLVPFVVEVLRLIGSYSRDAQLKNLISMYIIDNEVSDQTEEDKRVKYALINIAMEYCGGLLEFFNKEKTWSDEKIIDIALKARNRLEKRNNIIAKFEKFLIQMDGKTGKELDDMVKSFDEECVEKDKKSEDALFDLYYDQIIEPLFFDKLNYGGTFLGHPRNEFDIEMTLQRLKLTDEIDKDVARFMISDIRRALENNEREYLPFWIWGSEKYLEIMNRINLRSKSLKEDDEEISCKVKELIHLLSEDVDISNFESVALFGAKYLLLVNHFVNNGNYYYEKSFLTSRNININDVIEQYHEYGDALHAAAVMKMFDNCHSSYLLWPVSNWSIFFHDLYDFELHGAKTEKKYKAFLNRAKHYFNDTVR